MSGDFNTEIECATAQNFIDWFNAVENRELRFSERPSEAPDFVYRDNNGEIRLEITTVYYDQNHAQSITETARGRRRPPTIQEAADSPETVEVYSVAAPELQLQESIDQRLRKKCEKDYGSNSILVIRIVHPALTSDYEIETAVIPNISVPQQNPFMKIFLTRNQTDYFEIRPTSP